MSDLLDAARQALAQGNKSKATDLLKQAVTQDPRNDAIWEALAGVVEKKEQAIDCLQRAVACNPANDSARRKLAALTRPEQPPLQPVPARSQPVVSTNVSAKETKRCPYCAEEIQAAAIVCKHCGRDLTGPNKPTQPPAQATSTSRRSNERPAKAVDTAGSVSKVESFIDATLTSEERVLYRAQLHWVVYLRAALTILFGLAFMLLALGTRNTEGAIGPVGVLFCFGGSLFVFAGLFGLVGVFILIRTTEFALTNKRVTGKRGFIRRHSLEVMLVKVESIRVDQSILGRMLNYGTVTVVGTGGTQERFPLIANPLEFRRRVQQQLGRASS